MKLLKSDQLGSRKVVDRVVNNHSDLEEVNNLLLHNIYMLKGDNVVLEGGASSTPSPVVLDKGFATGVRPSPIARIVH